MKNNPVPIRRLLRLLCVSVSLGISVTAHAIELPKVPPADADATRPAISNQPRALLLCEVGAVYKPVAFVRAAATATPVGIDIAWSDGAQRLLLCKGPIFAVDLKSTSASSELPQARAPPVSRYFAGETYTALIVILGIAFCFALLLLMGSVGSYIAKADMMVLIDVEADVKAFTASLCRAKGMQEIRQAELRFRVKHLLWVILVLFTLLAGLVGMRDRGLISAGPLLASATATSMAVGPTIWAQA